MHGFCRADFAIYAAGGSAARFFFAPENPNVFEKICNYLD